MSMSSSDQALMAFASQHRGDLDGLLKKFFGFLHTHTDLYVVDDNPSVMGFKPGEAEAKVLAAFRSFPYKKPPSPESTQKRSPKPESVSTRASAAPPSPATLPKPGEVQVPIGNGGQGPGYVWTQTLSEINAIIVIPPNTRSKDLEVDIKSTSVRVFHRPTKTVLLEDEYPVGESVDVSESTWTLDETLMLLLMKRRETWWPCLIRGHPQIDTTKVDSSRRIEEYDPETRAAILKLMAEQRSQNDAS